MEYSCERLSVFEGECATPFFESVDPFTPVHCAAEKERYNKMKDINRMNEDM